MDKKTAEQLIWDEDVEGYKPVTDEEIVDKTRWSVVYERVFENTSDGTFWNLSWSGGATEYQEDTEADVYIVQVYPHQVMETVYKTKKPV